MMSTGIDDDDDDDDHELQVKCISHFSPQSQTSRAGTIDTWKAVT